MAAICAAVPGVRILRQDPFEQMSLSADLGFVALRDCGQQHRGSLVAILDELILEQSKLFAAQQIDDGFQVRLIEMGRVHFYLQRLAYTAWISLCSVPNKRKKLLADLRPDPALHGFMLCGSPRTYFLAIATAWAPNPQALRIDGLIIPGGPR
jgi:hypothetical protein